MGMVDILKTLFVELDMKLKAKVISRRGLNPARITWPGGGGGLYIGRGLQGRKQLRQSTEAEKSARGTSRR